MYIQTHTLPSYYSSVATLYLLFMCMYTQTHTLPSYYSSVDSNLRYCGCISLSDLHIVKEMREVPLIFVFIC